MASVSAGVRRGWWSAWRGEARTAAPGGDERSAVSLERAAELAPSWARVEAPRARPATQPDLGATNGWSRRLL